MSTRQRSTRAKAPKTYAESDGEQEKEFNYEEQVDTEEEAAFPSKASSSKKVAGRKRGAPSGGKPKTGKPAKRRRNQLQGKLEDFKKLPLELQLRSTIACSGVGYSRPAYLQIFELLHPRILMLMSRTNHEYRELLLSTDTVWKQSRLRSGMPDLQAQDITERQYILLMLIRLATAHKTTEAQLRKFLATLHPRAKECAKVTKPFDAGSYYVCDGGYRIPRGIKKLSDKLNKMNKQEVDDFVAKRLALKAAIAKDAKNICDWIDEEHSAKDGTKAENQEERAHQIKERLLAMGWTEERYAN
ncbi:hypothetical protein BDZ89DRAFT_1146219 [Hymenopellis radicata]|nr:hypothetical protein BDZ89DRAFT_1146219 [Hymenopellis radicata]